MSKRVLFSGYSYSGLLEGFRSRGWEVISRPDLEWWAWCWGNLPGVPQGSPHDFGRHLLTEVSKSKPDLVIVGKGWDSNRHVATTTDWYWKYDLPSFWHIQPGDLAAIRAQGARVIALTLDAPDDVMFSTNCRLIENVDAIGTCCIDVAPIYQRFGLMNVFEFRAGWDETERGRPTLPRQPVVDFVFIGSPYLTPNPEFGLPRRDVIRTALEAGLSIELYGPEGWLREHEGGDAGFSAIYQGPAQHGQPGICGLPTHEILRRGRLTYTSHLRRGTRYYSDRVPLAGGAGVFLLSEEQRGMDEVFQGNVHIGYHRFRDRDDLRQQFAYWTAAQGHRQDCEARMQQKIFGEHLYQHRADDIIRQYERLVDA